MASIQARDCQLHPDTTARAYSVSLRQPTGSSSPGSANLECTVAFRATGRLRGSAGELVEGWRIGFIQLKHNTTDWAEYRGLTSAEGSVFAAMDRPPARLSQLCRDSRNKTGIFYNPDEAVSDPRHAFTETTILLSRGTRLPPTGALAFEVYMSDSPSRHYPLVTQNTAFRPSRPNYIRALESRAAFVSLLAGRGTWVGNTKF